MQSKKWMYLYNNSKTSTATPKRIFCAENWCNICHKCQQCAVARESSHMPINEWSLGAKCILPRNIA